MLTVSQYLLTWICYSLNILSYTPMFPLMSSAKAIAHTLEGHPASDWEPLYGPAGHAAKVASLCGEFCRRMSNRNSEIWFSTGHFLGLVHDMGKAHPCFQAYLRGAQQGYSHKKDAAQFLIKRIGNYGVFLAYVCYGHHGGLPAAGDFVEDLKEAEDRLTEVPELRGTEVKGLVAWPVGSKAVTANDAMFARCMAARMLHSSLIDADWLATESFCEPVLSEQRSAGAFLSMDEMSARLEEYLGDLEHKAQGEIAGLRAEIHAACNTAGRKDQGVYKLNVPTGGGKTLASLSFALEHVKQHGLERVIYVIPFTSIIEQTAAVFREALKDDGSVLEHHSNIVEESDTAKNRFAAENWDAPLIVTTNVQFFESLFAAKNKRCRKLHNIARSVIIFDEAQSLPTEYLAPCLAALKCLEQDYECSLLLCTATQPALENIPAEKFSIGWPAAEVRSLIGVDLETRLAEKMKRAELHFIGEKTHEELIEHFNAQNTNIALFIVNLTLQAQELVKALEEKDYKNVYHLSARMCPAHRSKVLEEVKNRLKQGEPTLLVSTRVIEAGVDISFPLVYRDRCGLDSLAQSAGRCNRGGEKACGYVFAYEAKEYALPTTFVDACDGVIAMRNCRENHPELDALSPEIAELYSREFLKKRGERTKQWDIKGIMPMIGTQQKQITTWDFPKMAEAFQLIPFGQRAILTPWGAGEQLRTRLVKLNSKDQMPTRQDFRDAQQLSVNVYMNEWEKLPKECIHKEADIWMLAVSAYDETLGVIRDSVDCAQHYIY